MLEDLFQKKVIKLLECKCPEEVGDSTHGSLALKAYQQNLYLKYYY